MKTAAARLLLLALALDVVPAPAAAPAPGGGLLAGRGLPPGVTNAVNQVSDALGNAANNPAVGNAANNAAQSATTTAANLKSDQSTSLESNTLLTIINKAFNTDSDSIDPENGTMKWKGHSYSLGETRLFRSRFEQYLALAPVSNEKAYQGALDHITSLLATNNTGDMNEASKQAWLALYAAAEYSTDGGYALSIANQVYDAWPIRDSKDAQSVVLAGMEKLRKQQQAILARDVDITQQEIARQGGGIIDNLSQSNSKAPSGAVTLTVTGSNNVLNPGGSGGGSEQTKPNNGKVNSSKDMGFSTMSSKARELATLEASIKAKQAEQALTQAQAKLQFQSQILGLFLQRRFQHVLIASSFYRIIFKGSAQEIDAQYRDVIADFLPASGNVPFYISTIENLAREAINQARQGMAAVNSNFDAGLLMAATERLQETFFLDEYTGEVLQLEKPKREKILAFYRKADEARKLADLKDYESILRLNSELSSLAKDFRSTEVTAAAQAAERSSQLALAYSKQAASIGDLERAGTQLERAVALWPLNPEIAAYGTGVAASASLSSQAAALFDDAYQHAEYRRIYDRRNELAVGLAADIKRGPQFKAVIERMTKVELALAQAQEAANQNSFAVAWDTLATAAALSPEDSTVNQRKAELAPRVADYVGLADKAKLTEERGEEAASLTYYLAVQDINPTSPVARLGIERVTKKLLARLADETVSAAAEKK
ncbi:MAG: hypothetical protein WCL04_06685 [Verrucomicrobiota bacterium]